MTTNRRAAGQLSRDSGEDFEDWVRRHHLEAERLGIVAGPVEHNEPHGKIINGKWEMVGAGIADFTGVLFDGNGGSLASEAKKRTGHLRRHGKGGISSKQQAHLDTVVRGGGKAFLLVRFVETVNLALLETEFAVPWQLVPWQIKRTAESVGPEDLAPWLVPKDRACYLEKYCPVRGPVVPGRRYPRE